MGPTPTPTPPQTPKPKPNPNSKCVVPMVNEDPLDMKSECVKPSEAKPNPKSKCTPPMVNIDPIDMTSKCVSISEVTPPNTPKPNPNSKCVVPMVNVDPLDMTSACVPPSEAKPNPNSECTPPMVNEDPLDMTSKCVSIVKVIYIIIPRKTSKLIPKCVPPMVKVDPLDPTSKCVLPINPDDYKCGDSKVTYKPFFRDVNSTIIDIEKRLCSKESMMKDKIEVRGFIKSPKLAFSKKVLSSIEITFMNKNTLEIYKPTIIKQTYIVQLTKGKYKIIVNSPYFAKVIYEKNIQKSSCETNLDNIITLLVHTKSGVEITMTPLIPISIGDKVQLCNSTQFNSTITDFKKKIFNNLRGEVIKGINDERGKLKLSTNDMKDDVVIYISNIAELLKDGHRKLHILTDDGSHHIIDVPLIKDSKKNS